MTYNTLSFYIQVFLSFIFHITNLIGYISSTSVYFLSFPFLHSSCYRKVSDCITKFGSQLCIFPLFLYELTPSLSLKQSLDMHDLYIWVAFFLLSFQFEVNESLEHAEKKIIKPTQYNKVFKNLFTTSTQAQSTQQKKINK